MQVGQPSATSRALGFSLTFSVLLIPFFHLSGALRCSNSTVSDSPILAKFSGLYLQYGDLLIFN